MAKKAAVDETAYAPNCNTLITQGMSLNDKPRIQQRLFEAGKYFDQVAEGNEPEKAFAATLFPSDFYCSHCGTWHELSEEDLNRELFGKTGTLDLKATSDQLKGILEFRAAQSGGSVDGSDSGNDGTQSGEGQ